MVLMLFGKEAATRAQSKCAIFMENLRNRCEQKHTLQYMLSEITVEEIVAHFNNNSEPRTRKLFYFHSNFKILLEYQAAQHGFLYHA